MVLGPGWRRLVRGISTDGGRGEALGWRAQGLAIRAEGAGQRGGQTEAGAEPGYGESPRLGPEFTQSVRRRDQVHTRESGNWRGKWGQFDAHHLTWTMPRASHEFIPVASCGAGIITPLHSWGNRGTEG